MAKNDRYLPRADGTTFCNIFVRDYVKQMGRADLLPDLQGSANDQFDALSREAAKPDGRWEEKKNLSQDPANTFKEAQDEANKTGKPVVIAYSNPGDHGHIAVIVPHQGDLGESTAWGMRVPYIAQAGADAGDHPGVFADDKMSWGFKKENLKDMRIFIAK